MGAPLAEIVAECLERLEAGESDALEELCSRHPAQAAQLRERITHLRDVGLLGAPPEEGRLPRRVGGFRIVSLLGSGGMGVVYLAEQADLGRRVALKLVRPEQLVFPGARERFRREIAAVARMQHAGIVPVFTGGESDGVPYYAMEHVAGATLDEVLATLAGREPGRLAGADLRRAVLDVLRRRGVDPDNSGAAASPALFDGTWTAACLRVAHQVADALQHAHERGVVHRDVKPSNVMLTPGGRVLLLDFGLAAAEGSERLTTSGSRVGSLAWASPEQVRGEHAALDARTDVYSLGATLYELLTLRTPFATGDPELTRQRILAGCAVPARELNPALPRDAETVCAKAMDLERERRYASAADFAADLSNVLERRPVAARRPGAALKLLRWAQRNPPRAAAAGLAALLLLGAPLGYALLQGRAAAEQKTLNEQLLASNTRLDAALGDLQARRADLEAALGRETAERQAAQRAFDRSRAAVDELLSTVAATDLRDVPQMEPVRRELLEKALAFYRELEAEAPLDTAVRADQVGTRRDIADLLSELGRYDEAAGRYDEVLADLRRLVAERPADAELRYRLASALANAGRVQRRLGREEQGAALLEQARGELEQVAAGPDPLPSAVRDLGVVLTGLGISAHEHGRTEEGVAQLARAAELFTGLCAAHPDSLDYSRLRAVALQKTGSVTRHLGRVAEAQALQRQAWDELNRLLELDPRGRELRSDLVECAVNYSGTLASGEDRALELEVVRRGYDVARALSGEFPQEPHYRAQCGGLGVNLAAAYANQRRFEEARPVIDETRAQLEQLQRDQPGRPDIDYLLGGALTVGSVVQLGLGALEPAARQAEESVRRLRDTAAALAGHPAVNNALASALIQGADVKRAAGEPAAALALAQEGLGLHPSDPASLYQAADVLGACAAPARGEPPPPDLRGRCEELALAALRRAVEQGYRDVERLRTAPSLAALRARPEFEELLAQAAAGAGPAR